MAAPTTKRVQFHTRPELNKEIEQLTINHISEAIQNPNRINKQIEQLDKEWDVERTLEANASTLILISIGLGILTNRKLLLFPAIIAGFLLQHAIQGWCPPLAILRRLKMRTQSEIDQERFALKLHRGDFKDMEYSRDAESIYRACAA